MTDENTVVTPGQGEDSPRLTAANLLDLALANDPLEFQRGFDSLVSDRVVDAVAARRLEVAAELFGGKAPVEEPDPKGEAPSDDETDDEETEEDGEDS